MQILKNQRAFTMIELLVVATIMILLTTIGLISFSQASISSRNAKRKADLETLRQALTLYKQDYGYYANASTVSFSGLVSTLYTGEYLSTTTLTDPKNVSPYVYQATCSLTSGGTCTKVTLSTSLESNATAYSIIAL